MPKILILGANGQLARNATRVFLCDTDARLTLFLREARRLANPDPIRATQDDAVDYRITKKGEAFKGHDVSLNSLSDLIVKPAMTPGLHIRESLGVSRTSANP